MEDDRLTLADDAGRVVTTLRAPSSAEQKLIGRWNAPAPTEGDRSFVDFDPAGVMTGRDDCNSIFGRWRASDDSIRVSDFGSTTVGCFGDDPSITTALTEAHRWRIESVDGSDVLTLLSKSDQDLMQLTRVD